MLFLCRPAHYACPSIRLIRLGRVSPCEHFAGFKYLSQCLCGCLTALQLWGYRTWQIHRKTYGQENVPMLVLISKSILRNIQYRFDCINCIKTIKINISFNVDTSAQFLTVWTTRLKFFIALRHTLKRNIINEWSYLPPPTDILLLLLSWAILRRELHTGCPKKNASMFKRP